MVGESRPRRGLGRLREPLPQRLMHGTPPGVDVPMQLPLDCAIPTEAAKAMPMLEAIEQLRPAPSDHRQLRVGSA